MEWSVFAIAIKGFFTPEAEADLGTESGSEKMLIWEAYELLSHRKPSPNDGKKCHLSQRLGRESTLWLRKDRPFTSSLLPLP